MTRLYRRLASDEKAGSRPIRVGPLILVALLAGCGSIEIPMPSDRLAAFANGRHPLTLPANLDARDAEVLRAFSERLFERSDEADAEDGDLTWHNADTGSMGTILPIRERRRRSTEECRDFSSTVTSVAGIHRYLATSCMTPGGDVVLKSISGAE